MSVSNELLLKAAKVYDCSEPVEGMKPKTQYEEHKKMTPDEFSRENSKSEEKAAAKAHQQASKTADDHLRKSLSYTGLLGGAGAAAGAGVGSLYGLLTGKKGKRLQSVLRGAGGGALIGGGLGLGTGAGVSMAMPRPRNLKTIPLSEYLSTLADKPENLSDNIDRLVTGLPTKELQRRFALGGLAGGAAGLAGGSLLTAGLTPEQKDYEEHKDLSPDEFSRENSESSKEAFMTPDFKKNMKNDMARLIVPQLAGSLGGQAGGLLGLIGGGIHGAYDPGSYAGLDEKGNPAVKRRSRLMGALRGAAGYGLGGALAGSIAGRAGGHLYANSKYAPVGQQAPANIVPLNKSSAALSFGEKVAVVLFKQSASPFDVGFTQSGAPTASWANKGYNPHQAINAPKPQQPMGHVMDADKARFQFATANNPQARVNAQTAFASASRAANSANVAVGGKPVYSPTQQPMN